MQPDTIIPSPSNPQGWNRFSYGMNNPVGYNDPTGHMGTKENDPSKNGCSHSYYCKDGKPDDSLKKKNDGDAGDAHDRHPSTSDYYGPIPKVLQDQMIANGADPDLLNQTDLIVYNNRASSGACAPGSGYAGNSFGTQVEICQTNYLTDNSGSQPSGVLIHELVHVRQYLDDPVGHIITNATQNFLLFIIFRGDEGKIHDNNSTEIEAMTCQKAINQNYNSGNGLIPLNTAPCNLTSGK